ncbi:MAG: cell wall metabolism sensor histidine kinase WalK [Anaerolineae bacterium]|jgi:two-component system phosphate regulon sensor histidine kinase PhoR|nr:cell wall metabolism sensor histidine kinase WalK [Anaerolineae bacterium]
MLEFLVLALGLAAGVLWFRYDNAREQLKAARESEARLRSDLAQRQQMVNENEAALRARDAAIKELQTSLNAVANAPASRQQPSSEWVRDLTARSELLIHLANTTEDALLILDRQLRVLNQNTAALQRFPKLATGVRLSEITDSPALLALVENTFEYGDDHIEEQITLSDDILLVRARSVKQGDRPLLALALQDISQLVKLNRARRDMVANISHELRHPIANIRLIIDGLFHEQDKPKRKESINSIKQIAHETDLLLWLVQSMADLSMIESGQAIVRMVEVNLGELVEASIDRFASQAERKRLIIARNIPTRLRALCDRDLIQRVLANLLHNAIKWTPEVGSITVTANAEGEEIVVSVLDSGPGVPTEQIERIFERFYQVDPSRSGRDGTGLGLAICKHIVEAHGGRIWAEGNDHGAGGRFRFTLLNADSLSAPQLPEATLNGQ